jgi:hypothetical protein
VTDTRRGDQPDDGWDGSWQAHRERQRTAWLQASPAQRLAWLEQAIALAHRTGALPRRRDDDADGQAGGT